MRRVELMKQRHDMKIALRRSKNALEKKDSLTNQGYGNQQKKIKTQIKRNLKKSHLKNSLRRTNVNVLPYFLDPDKMSPTDWYRNIKTNEVVWMDGHKNYKGYENLGHHNTYKDIDANVTFLDGDNKTISYNDIVIKSFKTSDIHGGIDYALDNIASPIFEGVQILGYTVFGTGIMFKEMLNDINKGGDGTGLRVKMNMPVFEFKDGNLVQTDLNEYSESEIITSGLSATGLVIGGNTGMGAVANWAEATAAKAAAKKMIEKVVKK